MTILYFDRRGQPITASRWSELREQRDYKVIKQQAVATPTGEVWVSTVWLGLDHSYGGAPLIFETLVFPDEKHMERYSTEEGAIKGHDSICERAATGEWL